MKLLLGMVLLTMEPTAYGKTNSCGAASVQGCGAANIEFNVKTDDKQRSAVQPDAAKAHVYFLQDDAAFLLEAQTDDSVWTRWRVGRRDPQQLLFLHYGRSRSTSSVCELAGICRAGPSTKGSGAPFHRRSRKRLLLSGQGRCQP